jgi:hypothetical protein
MTNIICIFTFAYSLLVSICCHSSFLIKSCERCSICKNHTSKNLIIHISWIFIIVVALSFLGFWSRDSFIFALSSFVFWSNSTVYERWQYSFLIIWLNWFLNIQIHVSLYDVIIILKIFVNGLIVCAFYFLIYRRFIFYLFAHAWLYKSYHSVRFVLSFDYLTFFT